MPVKVEKISAPKSYTYVITAQNRLHCSVFYCEFECLWYNKIHMF